jgi:sn-glycerol 3-phosphate transport system permease protein
MKLLTRTMMRIGALVFSCALLLAYFIPIYWMVITSLKSAGGVLVFPPTFLVPEPQWNNFADAYRAFPFLHYLKNSLIVSISIILCQCITVIPAAYAFARLDFRGKSFFFGLTLASVMIPAQLVFLPIFLLMSKLGLINTYASLILPSASSAFGIFMLRQTFKQVPEEIIEAARLDKASELSIIFNIMLPIARPTLAALGLLTFISVWNDYFWPFVLTTNDTVRTLPLGIASLKMLDAGLTIPYHTMMAGNLMLIAPVIILFVVAQKQIVSAFTYMGEK